MRVSMSEEKLVKQLRSEELNKFIVMNISNRVNNRIRRHKSVRKFVRGTSSVPRLSVYKSNKHIFAQIIDDNKSVTIVGVGDIKADKKAKTQRAFEIGKKLAQAAVKKGIEKVVFDRGGFLYHGRIAKLAEGAREGGLKF